MGSDPIERTLGDSGKEQPPVFALVIYIPGPLGEFLDDLRRELVPGCNPHAHVSLLPPRPLSVDWKVASRQAASIMETWSPFEVELTTVEVFPATDVVYVEVGDGAHELHRMHRTINTGPLQFADPFPYHPHSTLAQGLDPGRVAEIRASAIRRWNEYRGSRRFLAESAMFVRSTRTDCWIDLAEYELGRSAVKS